MLAQMVIFLCKLQSAYLWGYQSDESWVLHFIWKSAGWFPLCLSVRLFENSFFWKMVLFWQWFFFCKSCFAVDANVYQCISLRLRCLPGYISGCGTWKVLFVLAYFCEAENMDGGLMEKPVTIFTLCSVGLRGCSFYVSGGRGAWRHQCLWRIPEISFSCFPNNFQEKASFPEM